MSAGAVAPAPHLPVLIDEVLAGLAGQSGETHVDGTFGAGGYTRALLGAGAGRVIAFDRDPDAIADGPSLVPDPRLTLIHEKFGKMDEALIERDLAPVDGVTLDIGVSSMQLDRAERGFAFSKDGPLDMRMSQAGESAADFVNHADEVEIARVLTILISSSALTSKRLKARRRFPSAQRGNASWRPTCSACPGRAGRFQASCSARSLGRTTLSIGRWPTKHGTAAGSSCFMPSPTT